jgi:superfamily I DNA and/or RNA helicase
MPEELLRRVRDACRSSVAAADGECVLRSAGLHEGDESDEHLSGLGPAIETAAEIGVITPYTAQVREIVAELKRSGIPAYAGGYDMDAAQHKSTRARIGVPAVEVSSVDGFQGREKAVIVFSCVRSNSANQLGFLSDWRRLNVALTRSKRGLVVVGDSSTLRADEWWSSWLNFVLRNGLQVDPDARVV